MNQSNTPRTDAAIQMDDSGYKVGQLRYVLPEFARQLETELADANKRADEWKRMAEELAALLRFANKHDGYRLSNVQALAKFDQMKGKL